MLLRLDYHLRLVEGTYNLCFAAHAAGDPASKSLKIQGLELGFRANPRRSISIAVWAAVALRFGHSLEAIHPGQGKLFARHRERVMEYAARYSASQAIFYDRLYRGAITESHGYGCPDWNPGIEFYSEAFCGTVAARCWCGMAHLSEDHDAAMAAAQPVVTAPPMPPSGGATPPARHNGAAAPVYPPLPQGPPPPGRNGGGRSACRNWNTGRGCASSPCSRAHVCSGCGDPAHRAGNCPHHRGPGGHGGH